MIDWPTEAQASYWANIITIIGLPIAAIALLATLRQLWLGQRTGSVTALASIHDSLRECWSDYFKAVPADKTLAFGDLCNTLEIACAASFDKVFFGRSGEVLRALLLSHLHLIERDDDLRNIMLGFLQDHMTFLNIRKFLTKNREAFGKLSFYSRE